MKCINNITLFNFMFCSVATVAGQNIIVDDSYTAKQLVENVLISSSSCAATANPSATGDTFTAGKQSYAYFNNQGGTFPFKEGVLLSTWSSIYSKGPFLREPSSGPNSGSTNWKGDLDLEQALGISNTSNATVLKFNFTALTNLLSFNYLFASNEYQDDFPCNYSDGFAFLIRETGTTAYQNLAVIPGTTTPVSSKNIHPVIPVFNSSSGPRAGCAAVNEAYFGSLNTAVNNNSPINYSGQTKVLNAQSKVTVGKTYEVKLVIADQGGTYYDSAIFIEAGSFTSKIDLGPDRTSPTNPVCYGDQFVIDTQLSPTYVYRWYKDSSSQPIIGQTSPSLTVSDTGNYRVEVELGSSNCIATGAIKIEFTAPIPVTNSTLIQCDDNGDGIATYDLTRLDNLIKNNFSSNTIVYYETLAEAKAKLNPITNVYAYTSKFPNQILIAGVTNETGCTNFAEAKLTVSNNTIGIQNPITICDADNSPDGFNQFDLNAQVTPQILAGLPLGLLVEYYKTESEAIAQKNPLPNLFTNTVVNQQIIYARLVNGPDCYNVTPQMLVVSVFSPPNFQDEKSSLCDGDSTTLTVGANYAQYLWNTGDTTNTITVSLSGEYSVQVFNANGCSAIKKFYVSPSGVALITNVKIEDFSGNANSVLVEYSGSGNYEFSIDGIYFQENPLFTGVAAGEYQVLVNDKNGCGLSLPFTVYVLDYPRFFTPNGDGFNDVWVIKNLNLLPKSTVAIFDRYGKLLKQLTTESTEWNGTLSGAILPADDYWFSIIFEDGKTIKGHFSLKR